MLGGENTEILFVGSVGGSGFDEGVEQEGYAQGPERALMLALLFDAVHVILAGNGFSRTSECSSAFREALAWLLSNDREYVFSFENVCEGLGLNPCYLRLGVINVCNAGRFRQIRKRD